MAPKPSRGGSGREEKEDTLQGVIIASCSPFATTPLANKATVNWALEYLDASGIKEIFLYTNEEIDRCLEPKWTSSKKVTCFRCASASVGDVMRDLDQKHIITGDFVCISGDVVSNFPLEAAVKAHKARRAENSNAVMTMVLAVSTRERACANMVVPTFTIDPTANRCLHYEESRVGEVRPHLSVDDDTMNGIKLLDMSEIDIRQDLQDCRIDICAPDVLGLWSDNFDNQAPRKDFLYGVLKDHELNGKTIHTHVIAEHYAARVGSFMAYHRITRDILERRVSPFCLDNNLFSGDAYQKTRNGVYREGGVAVARSSQVGAGSVLGSGTSIGFCSVVKNSILGRRCRVGNNVNITDSYVWDGASIGNDVKILKAIIANDAVVGDGATISEGAMVSAGAQVAKDATVRSHGRVTCRPDAPATDEEDGDELGDLKFSTQTRPPRYSYSADAVAGYTLADLTSSTSSLSSASSEGSEILSSHVASRSGSFATTMSDEDHHPNDRFHFEAVSNLFERMQANAEIQDVRVELVGSRLAHDASEHQERKAVAVAMMKHIRSRMDSGAKAEEISHDSLTRYRDLIRSGKGQDTLANQVDFLLEVQKDLVHRTDGGRILYFITKEAYDEDIFEEDVIMAWWNDERSASNVEMENVRGLTGEFIKWLETAESESSDAEY